MYLFYLFQFQINVGHYVKRGHKIASAGSFPLTLKENACEEVEVEWGFYALSASKAIFRARTYNCNLFSPVVLSATVRKHQTFNSRFNPTLNYKLVYKDLRVADTIPGSDEVFSMKAYKEKLAIPYSRIRNVYAYQMQRMYCL